MLTKRVTVMLGALVVALAASGCTDSGQNGVAPGPVTGPDPGLSASGSAGPGLRPQRLARRVALALRNPAFRAYVKAQLDHSPFREHKLPFQAFLRANGRRALGALAAESGEHELDVAGDADSAEALEFYMPVRAHRAAWTGDENVLVATAETDDDPPVAFDTRGRRTVLDPRAPPAIPVLAVVPVETDFSIAPSGLMACPDPEGCAPGSGGTGTGTGGTTTSEPHGLFMTALHIVDNYEGWLKGDPEYEVHVLGQVGQSDSMTSYQCAGEHAGGPYYFDQDNHDYVGGTPVLLFSQTQLDNYRVQHPGQAIRLLFLEDDDTACRIVVDPNRMARLVNALIAGYGTWTAGTDTTFPGTVVKSYTRARTLINILSAIAAIIKTNDELIGSAIEDSIVGEVYPGYNWIIKGDYTMTKGWVNLEMR